MTTVSSMREFLKHTRYHTGTGTVLSSEFKDILTPTHKIHKQYNNANHGGIKKYYFSQPN